MLNRSMSPHTDIQLDNVAIPACVRGFASDATSFDVSIKNGAVVHIQPSKSAMYSVANKPGASAASIAHGCGPQPEPQAKTLAKPSGMLIPALADLHVHLDKTYVVDEVGAPDGDLFKAIGLMAARRDGWTGEAIHQRMARAIAEAYACGTRAMRTHLDWPDAQPPRALAAFEALRDAWRGRVALQCVSLTPLDVLGAGPTGAACVTGANGITGASVSLAGAALGGLGSTAAHAIAAELARFNQRFNQSLSQRCDPAQGEAALLGAFVYRNEHIAEKLQRVFDLARQYKLSLDFHVDEGLDADACGLRTIAELTVHNDFQGKVTCGHSCSLSVQPVAQARETLKLCARAGIHLVALPSTNLYLQGAWDTTPVERGITRLKEALALGIPTSIATDNVADGFFPYGSYDLLDNFCLGVQVAHLSPAEAWLTHITTHPAQAMGLAWDGKIVEGCPADFLLLDARNGFELMTPGGRQRRVIRGGVFIEPSNTADAAP